MRRSKLKPYKISRGSLEQEKLREDNRFETQRALLIILPVVMIAVLFVGVYFAYIGYQRQEALIRELEHETATEPEEADPMLLRVVSSAFPLSEDYVPELEDFEGVQVSPEMADSLTEMLDAASAAGYEIYPDAGYISYGEQRELYDKAVDEYRKSKKVSLVKAEATVRRSIPREGESEAQTGLLISLTADVEGAFENSSEYAWLFKNCADYGFILRYRETENAGGLSFSPHLFRYVGVENAYFITAYDMSLDEYSAYIDAR